VRILGPSKPQGRKPRFRCLRCHRPLTPCNEFSNRSLNPPRDLKKSHH
jgi:hypothetical protein